MLKRTLLVLGLTAGGALAHAGEVLRVYGGEGRLAPGLIEEFQQQTGIRVEYEAYGAAEDVLSDEAFGRRYDVVFPVHFQLPALVAAQRLQLLDPARLPNLKQIDPDLDTMLDGSSAQTRHAVPYQWGTVGLALNVAKVTEALGAVPEESWSLLFDARNNERLAKCGIGMLDARQEILSLLLNYKGRTLARSGPRQVQQAGEELAALRGKVATFGNRAYIEQLASGQLCAAIAWSGHALKGADAGAQLSYVMPREGALMFIDTMAIPSNAQNVAAAHRFIDYLAGAEVNTRNARETLFYPVIRGDAPAMGRLASERKDLVVASGQRRSFYYLESLSPRQKTAVDAAWLQVKR
ncbi:extracellular solute-binding protein [Pseudomonas sp. MAP12]|uniref:Extracellular solute-binding protein n=1 Tax=Geopseudomonas aromaticivorans TaxID=2849492 RepID=A0ABS6MY59_9GAMM|nr:extracellular solute-binding protein [Pseudomonas aromaticivorans]MBV2133749.1 extracellular solute-binding protein [Pseudomonas aromaticivorans]